MLDPGYAHENRGDREAIKARFDDLVENGSIQFVTFHQSFSYEDFVEGLRADAKEDGSISYYVADGVLKTLCRSMMATGPRLTPGMRFASGYVVSRSTDEILWLVKPNGSNLPFPWEVIDELSGWREYFEGAHRPPGSQEQKTFSVEHRIAGPVLHRREFGTVNELA